MSFYIYENWTAEKKATIHRAECTFCNLGEGIHPPTKRSEETVCGKDIYELIDQRSRSGSLVVASNRSPQDWYPLFPNPVLAEVILDRLINRAHHVILTGKTYRPLLRPGRAQAPYLQALQRSLLGQGWSTWLSDQG